MISFADRAAPQQKMAARLQQLLPAARIWALFPGSEHSRHKGSFAAEVDCGSAAVDILSNAGIISWTINRSNQAVKL